MKITFDNQKELNEYVKDYKQNELDESNMDWFGCHCIMEFNYCSD